MEFSVNVRILGDEKRFGFSVMGGEDEGFPPRIDEISEGMCYRIIIVISDRMVSPDQVQMFCVK